MKESTTSLKAYFFIIGILGIYSGYNLLNTSSNLGVFSIISSFIYILLALRLNNLINEKKSILNGFVLLNGIIISVIYIFNSNFLSLIFTIILTIYLLKNITRISIKQGFQENDKKDITQDKRTIISVTIMIFLVLFVIIGGWLIKDIRSLPPEIKKNIPIEFNDGLKVNEITKRKVNEIWHTVEIIDLDSPAPYKKIERRISLDDGYRAMYKYPDTQYFANVKIEKSTENEFENNKKIYKEWVKNIYDRKLLNTRKYLSENPQIKKEVDEIRAIGKDYLDFEDTQYKGYNYVSYTENVIGLTEHTISQIHIFIPEDEIIITAYLLEQENSKFKDIEEFLILRKKFIENYIDYIKINNPQIIN